MSNGYTEVKTIASLMRLKSSTLGNPSFRVTFTDGTSARTRANSSIAFSIENGEFRDVPVKVSFTAAGTIWNVETVAK